MSWIDTLSTVGTAVKEGYDTYNQFVKDNPLLVAAARQGINLAMAQGKGPQMNMPSNYSFRHSAPTGSTRVGSQNVRYAKGGMRLMKKGAKMYKHGGEMYKGGGQVNYMGGGQMERGHNDPGSSIIIKLAEQGMKMPRDKRAMLAEMLMRD
jgi:hypothetical protein